MTNLEIQSCGRARAFDTKAQHAVIPTDRGNHEAAQAGQCSPAAFLQKAGSPLCSACRALTIALLLLMCFLTSSASAAAENTLKADSAKKCAICHYRWVPTFFVEHRSSPIAALEEGKDAAGSRQMCLSCHDGSVRDSRDKICNDPGHRIGVVPSKRVTIPEKFPLDESGAMQCATCHTPHAVPAKGESLVSFFLRAPNQNSSFCKQCHKDNLGGKEKGNHPVDVALKTVPQPIIDAGGKLSADNPGQVICETCHMAHGGVNSKFLVLPAEDPTTLSVLCEVCHTKNPGRDKSSGSFSHPVDSKPGAAAQIPAVWKNGEKVVLGAGGGLVCRTCHKPHYAADTAYLLADQQGGDALCMQCHAGQAAVQGTTHDLRLTAPREQNIRKNPAQDTGPCSPCHLVHSGTAGYLWARRLSSDGRPDAYCASCHASGQCAEKKVPGGFSHPLATGAAEISAGRLPLYDAQGRKNTRGSMSCATCHDVHSPEPAYGAAAPKRGKFLRMGSQGSAAHCLQCHPDQGLVAGTAHDMSISAPGFKNVPGQSPSAGGVCASCHAAHNAPQKNYIWAAPLGKQMLPGWEGEKGAENNIMAAMCTGCHAPGGPAEKHVLGFGLHPEAYYCKASELTAELNRQGALLYAGEGKISSEGAIVCATCHNAHQWSGQKKIKGSGTLEEGTALTSFLRPDLPRFFCAGCHGSESLFKYLYFHGRSSREKKIQPFPFEEKR